MAAQLSSVQNMKRLPWEMKGGTIQGGEGGQLNVMEEVLEEIAQVQEEIMTLQEELETLRAAYEEMMADLREMRDQ